MAAAARRGVERIGEDILSWCIFGFRLSFRRLQLLLSLPIELGMSDPILAQYRASIDNIDAALIHMLAERFKVTQSVGRQKAETGLPAADAGREEAQINRLRQLAADAGLDPEFSEKFLRFIIDEVIRHHQNLAKQ